MTSQASFNLVDQPWIPCIDEHGLIQELDLRSTFARAHRLKAIACDTPPLTAALHRLLLAILHRVFGPGDEDIWASLWNAQQFDTETVNAYLNRCWPHFDLFDAERPFYQAPDKRMKPKSIINLSHEFASGNNPTLFDHHLEDGDAVLEPAQAARVLIAAQAFGLAGLSGIGQKFTDGASAGGITFLVEGSTLKETLLLNTLKYPTDNDHFPIWTELDAPAWEMADPFVPNRTQPLGYLDYLTWQNRRIHLIPETSAGLTFVKRMTMGPALRFDPLPLDPMKNYRMDKKLGPIATSFSEERTLWRDSASLLAFESNLQGEARTPATLRWLRHLVREVGVPHKHMLYRTLAIGLSKKQAKVFFFREERLPLPLEYLTDVELVAALDTALLSTGTIAFDLIQSARLMGMYMQLSDVDQRAWQKQWQSLNVNAKNTITDWITHTGIEQNYWSSLEIPFQALVIDLVKDIDRALSAWHHAMRRSAYDAFEQAAQFAGEDGRSLKAVVRSRNYFTYRLNEVLPPTFA